MDCCPAESGSSSIHHKKAILQAPKCHDRIHKRNYGHRSHRHWQIAVHEKPPEQTGEFPSVLNFFWPHTITLRAKNILLSLSLSFCQHHFYWHQEWSVRWSKIFRDQKAKWSFGFRLLRAVWESIVEIWMMRASGDVIAEDNYAEIGSNLTY